jgi:CDP-glucose 4,6-dehydratase
MDIRKDLMAAYRGKTVFITGHTGFKGGWLTLWLESLGANVVGYSEPAPSDPSFYKSVLKGININQLRANINDYPTLNMMIREYQPHYIFHLAAQPIVRLSYLYPRETFITNVMGTINILDCARNLYDLPICICVTSDKCYANKEWDYAYRENDPMGGHDPYSASKGAAELVIDSYRKSFFKDTNNIASVRSGNVIGGGDWGTDRIIPDCVRSIVNNEEIIIRNPTAVRPWQFVLEPLFGYMLLGMKMNENINKYDEAWNFGPNYNNCITVGNLVEKLVNTWDSDTKVTQVSNEMVHEASLLKLDIAKSVTRLGWQPIYNINQTINKLVEWYKTYYESPQLIQSFSLDQISDYMNDIDKQYR